MRSGITHGVEHPLVMPHRNYPRMRKGTPARAVERARRYPAIIGSGLRSVCSTTGVPMNVAPVVPLSFTVR